MQNNYLQTGDLDIADRMLLALADGLDPSSAVIDTTQVWRPEPDNKPQTAAYISDADIIGYGGGAGGGKSDLLLGFAGTKQYRSVIFRRIFPLLEGLESRSREIFNSTNEQRNKDRYNESLHRWELSTGATIRFAAIQYEEDKKNFQGRPFDFYGFDEATEFTESQFRFVTGWNRSTRAGQKCRIVLTFNPPMDEPGEWVVRYFAPWIDETHKNPAKDGELRWYSMLDGVEIELEDGKPFKHKGEIITPKSRTFFHAKLSDNKILENTGYGATIDAMPEPIRSLLRGKFGAYKEIDPFQLIQTSWVIAAQERWNNSESGEEMHAIGIDVARGGRDQTVFAALYGDRFDTLKKYPGVSTPDGQTVATLLNEYLGKRSPTIGVDVIGVGGAVFDALQHRQNVLGVNFGEGSSATDKTGKYQMANVRAEAYWNLRDALNPDYNPTLALPPDKELLGDLCSIKWRVKTGKIYIESKDEIVKRLGRSPDCSDAVAIALFCRDIVDDDWEGFDTVENASSRWK